MSKSETKLLRQGYNDALCGRAPWCTDDAYRRAHSAQRARMGLPLHWVMP